VRRLERHRRGLRQRPDVPVNAFPTQDGPMTPHPSGEARRPHPGAAIDIYASRFRKRATEIDRIPTPRTIRAIIC
jgi:hypothetical protein